MLTVVKSEGKWVRYKIYGNADSDEEFAMKNIFDNPEIGVTYMSIGNHQSTDVEEVIINKNSLDEFVNQLNAEV